ncbi:hypothetical protein TNIN_297641 [Trichonephila inaurata madagascariensis]|uniref:C2H2-type domain-containing protein n=1 Tax=Trichonephila inaurata madagascariensis TaxID=2747483 RepID=A0A8X6WZB7_9ARAC|nr:hypothetical protein TNIN_297641 [Trichonephila inaurata madagascariensis]
MTAERPGEDTKYVCDTCHRTFQFRRHYLKHMQVHKDTVFQKCFECAAAFNSYIQYLEHIEIHEQESTLKCLYCSECFKSPEDHRLHENQHTRRNRFICEICNRKFKTERSLQRHLPLHGAEKSNNSEVCNRGLTQKKAEETSTHPNDGKMQFKCHICEKIFRYKCRLKQHQETHSNEKSHSCPVCFVSEHWVRRSDAIIGTCPRLHFHILMKNSGVECWNWRRP